MEQKPTTRFFLVGTIGQNSDYSMVLNAIIIQTETGKYPTHKQCIDGVNDKYPGQTRLSVSSICEMSQEDYTHFMSDY